LRAAGEFSGSGIPNLFRMTSVPERIATEEGGRALSRLLAAGGLPSAGSADVNVRRITIDSREVQSGDLFVAVEGESVDGHEHAGQAVVKGACAIIAERQLDLDADIPVIRVPNSRRALARLAAAWYDFPARRVPIVGVTGTLGKTTVMSMLESILIRAGNRMGTIGSLGIRIDGDAEVTGYTAPDPIILHGALSKIVGAGADLAAMEVTTHALAQERVHGIEYDMGLFINLVPLEHVDYHGSFRGYVEVKTKFFEHLKSGAPLVYSHDDRAVRGVVRDRDLYPVGVGETEAADVRYEITAMDASGSRLTLRSSTPIRLLKGGERSFEIPIQLRTLGRSMAVNAALAATAALVAGADEEAVTEALASFPAPRRRMQVLRSEPFLVLDDTTAHPESIGVVFDVVKRLGRDRIHILIAIRGKRGVRINRTVAEALAIWLGQIPASTVVVTSSSEAADSLNRVTSREREAFLKKLETAGVAYEMRERLDEGVERLMERVQPGDLVLLLGAQGMDEGARLLEEYLDRQPRVG
jgi:UDP-N-acetylmuramoyl-L-alanyl-D-glutamate--2,6-diaminopimelate ligase